MSCSRMGAILAGLFLCGLAVYSGDPAWAVWGVVLGGFIVVAHRDNIERLLSGTERKSTWGKAPTSPTDPRSRH